MGLLDQVIGGVLGNVLGGSSSPGSGRAPSGGGLGDMIGGAASSPLVKALLMLLAAKAASGGFGDIFGRAEQGRAPQAPEDAPPSGGSFSGDNPFQGGRGTPPEQDGPYSDLAGAFDKPGAGPAPRDAGAGPYSGLDGEPAQSAAPGGLGGLIDSFQRGGLGDVIGSWIGHGENRPVAPNQLAQALGPDTVDTLARQTGMNRDDLLAQLSRVLPGVVDKLTPDGRAPNAEEMRRW